jgi:hypothetical protein
MRWVVVSRAAPSGKTCVLRIASLSPQGKDDRMGSYRRFLAHLRQPPLSVYAPLREADKPENHLESGIGGPDSSRITSPRRETDEEILK